MHCTLIILQIYARSLALVLEEFYEQIPHVAVSAATGQGMDRLFAALETCRAQYEELYKPEMEAKRKVWCGWRAVVCVTGCTQAGSEAEAARQAQQLAKLRLDMDQDVET